MNKFVPYEKMSKKAKKQYNATKRGSWGITNPVTRIAKPDTVYSRKVKHKNQNNDDYRGSGSCVLKMRRGNRLVTSL